MKSTRAVILPEYNDNLLRAMLSLKIGERLLPDLLEDEVLVKMEAATCNPSDIAFLRGGYNIIKPLPCVPGFEGTGKVVETGKSASELLGKRVSCFVQENKDGTWADYFIAKSLDCIRVRSELNIQQAACLSINPLTAWGLFEMVSELKTPAFIQNASGGQVSRILQQLAENHGVDVINIVRKTAVAENLRQAGAKYVIDTNLENDIQELKTLCQKLKVGVAFDAVSGELAGQMLNALPAGGQLIVYGALSGAAVSAIDPMGIIFHSKTVRGFNLNQWLEETSQVELEKIFESLQEMIINGKVSTNIQGIFKLDDLVKGLRTYIKSMSSGKIIFTP